MKIKTADMSYEQVLALPSEKHQNPRKQSPFFRWLIKTLSKKELREVHFHCELGDMGTIQKHEPCLYLMNHSCFLDLQIAFTLIAPKPFHIVCTSDGFVGKNRLMRAIGCIPTFKFITDVGLIKDMFLIKKKIKASILMYPEASYSFDGTATPLPEGLGKCIKKLDMPVVMIKTRGAFLRDPLYNGLQKRKVDVSARMNCIMTAEQLKQLTVEEINQKLKEEFTFDQFRNQEEDGVRIREAFRADGLNRVLYLCPHCKKEGGMTGKGVLLSCKFCGKEYTLTEYGRMQATEGETEFPHIADWYRYERESVRKEIQNGTYLLDISVKIGIIKDRKAVYMVGDGRLIHDAEGFHLTGCNGKLDYRQSPLASYSLYADYYWYEIGDMICIGDTRMLFYCFPQGEADVVAKTRLATEELYKIQHLASCR